MLTLIGRFFMNYFQALLSLALSLLTFSKLMEIGGLKIFARKGKVKWEGG